MFKVYVFNWKSSTQGVKIGQFDTFEKAENFIYRMKLQDKKNGYSIETANETWEY